MAARKLARPAFCAGEAAELSTRPMLSSPEPSLPVMRQFAPEPAALEQLVEVLSQLVLDGSQCESESTPCAFHAVE
jgi:hypothetical protein